MTVDKIITTDIKSEVFGRLTVTSYFVIQIKKLRTFETRLSYYKVKKLFYFEYRLDKLFWIFKN